MTCIVGVAGESSVAIGGDSASTSGWTLIVRSGFAAVGCGFAEAMGAMHAMRDGDEDEKPRECALRALEAAQALNAGVRGPFIVESIGEES